MHDIPFTPEESKVVEKIITAVLKGENVVLSQLEIRRAESAKEKLRTEVNDQDRVLQPLGEPMTDWEVDRMSGKSGE